MKYRTKNACFVSGHDFSRAANTSKITKGFSPGGSPRQTSQPDFSAQDNQRSSQRSTLAVEGKKQADDNPQPSPSGRDPSRISGHCLGWRGGKEAARGPVNSVAAAERTRLIYGSDGAPALRCLLNRAGDVARLAAAVRSVARLATQAAQGGPLIELKNEEKQALNWWQRFKRSSAHTQANIVCSFVVMLATIAYVIVAKRQLHEIKKTNDITQQALNSNDKALAKTLDKMQAQIDAMNTLATNAGKEADAAGRQADASGTIATNAVSQTQSTNNLAIAAGKQADASKTIAEKAIDQAKATNNLAAQTQRSADIASQQLAIAQAQFETADRPWISIVSVDPVHVEFLQDFRPSLLLPPEKNLGVQIKMTIKNIGNLPAVDVKDARSMYFANWSAAGANYTSIYEEAKKKQISLCASEQYTLPPEYETPTISPGKSKELNEGTGALIDDPGEILSTGGITPIIIGCIFYRYSSSSKVHHTGFIYYVILTGDHNAGYMRLGVTPPLSDVRIEDMSDIAFSD